METAKTEEQKKLFEELKKEPHTRDWGAGEKTHYLPYKDLDGNTQVLPISTREGSPLIDTWFESDKNHRFIISDIEIEKIGEKEILKLIGKEEISEDFTILSEGEKTAILPIDAKASKDLVETLQKIHNGESVKFKAVPAYKGSDGIDLPKELSDTELGALKDSVSKATTTTPGPSAETAPPTAEATTAESLKKDKVSSTIKTAQTLEQREFVFDGKKLSGLSQTIETGKLGMAEKQTLTLLDSGKSNVLAAIERSDLSAPVAVFTQNGDKISLSMSKDFVENFKASNPELTLPDGSESGGYVSFEVEKLKLDENLNIEDVQIKSAGQDFAVMISALGCQIKDKDGNLGIHKNTEKPFNVAVSTTFMQKAYSNENGCEIERKDPAQSALLISALQMARQEENKKPADKQKEPVVVEFGDGDNKVQLMSVPIKVKNDGLSGTQYLNIRKEIVKGKEKTFVYMHLTGEKNKTSTAPKFWEVNEASLEAAGLVDGKISSPSLYLGLAAGRNIARANLMMDFDDPVNAEALKILGNPADGAIRSKFEKTPHVADHDVATLTKTKVKEVDFDVYTRPAESSATIKSLSGIAELSRKATEDPGAAASAAAATTPPPTATQTNPSHIPNDAPQAPSGDGHEEEDDLEEGIPDLKKRTPDKETKEKKPLLKKETVKNVMVGVSMIMVMLSIFFPVLNFVAIGLLVGTAVYDTEPWKLITTPTKAIARGVTKAKAKHKSKEKGLSKQATKNKQKLAAATEKKQIAQQKIELLKERREFILNHPNLTKAEKDAKINAIDKQLEKAEKQLKNANTKTAVLDVKAKEISTKKEMAAAERVVAAREAINQKFLQEESVERNKLSEIEWQKELHTGQKSILEEEKAEMEELKTLMEKNPASLSIEEQERLKKLKARFFRGKVKAESASLDDLYKKISGVDKEISEENSQIENLQKEYDEKIAKINEAQKTREESIERERAVVEEKRQKIETEKKEAEEIKKKGPFEDFSLSDEAKDAEKKAEPSEPLTTEEDAKKETTLETFFFHDETPEKKEEETEEKTSESKSPSLFEKMKEKSSKDRSK